MFTLYFTDEARSQFGELKRAPALKIRCNAVKKALRSLERNPRSNALKTHRWKGKQCPHGDTLWEAYAQNRTPGAYRIFFCYPPGPEKAILIVAITPHP